MFVGASEKTLSKQWHLTVAIMKQINLYVAFKNNSDVQNKLITRCSNNSNLMKKTVYYSDSFNISFNIFFLIYWYLLAFTTTLSIKLRI